MSNETSAAEFANRVAESTAEPWCAALTDASEAAFVVDPALSRIEGANESARRLLGLQGAPVNFPVALDAAMPAVRRLRALSMLGGEEPGSTKREPDEQPAQDAKEVLTLWCAGRLVSLPAKVTRTSMNDGRPVMLINATPEDLASPEAPTSTNAAQSHIPPIPARMRQPEETASEQISAPIKAAAEPVANAPPAEAPRPPTDDSETLREIARRIREGGNARKITPTPSTTTSVDNTSAEPAQYSGPEMPIPPPIPNGADTSPPRSQRMSHQTLDARQLSKVAHELKTPLSAIVAAAEIMRDERLGPMGNARYLGYAADIHESARHALDVINAMLTGTHTEIRKSERVDLADLADITVSAMLPLAGANNITLLSDRDQGALYVTGDATTIRQIIFNLVSNALKFTPAGG
ncbi:MAG: HAMP domain-containing histidine kinase, partial [Hyphomicrobiaceae bacterium]|nr:HAMP domain-containing histidine kinase [Hyphomicrobiaceae bacterium]